MLTLIGAVQIILRRLQDLSPQDFREQDKLVDQEADVVLKDEDGQVLVATDEVKRLFTLWKRLQEESFALLFNLDLSEEDSQKVESEALINATRSIVLAYMTEGLFQQALKEQIILSCPNWSEVGLLEVRRGFVVVTTKIRQSSPEGMTDVSILLDKPPIGHA